MTTWRNEERRLREQFKNDLRGAVEDELCVFTDEVWERFFSQVWDNGHSDGYYEVANNACDLVDTIKPIIQLLFAGGAK
jgi:hypothetical protein